MSLVDKHPDQDSDRDGAQEADASRTRVGGASPIVRKRPSELLRERRQRIRRRRLTTAGVVLALALAAFYVWGPFHSPHKPELRSQGYTGTHTDTGRPSPKWANGTDIAWQLDMYLADSSNSAILKNGDQVILALPLTENDRFKVVSLDVSGAKPAIQWDSVLPKAVPRTIEPHLVMVGEDLFIGEHRLDPTTGAASPAPWAGRNQDGQDNPELATTIVITSHDGLVIACNRRICSGWVKEDGEWTMRWERDSTPTPLEDYQDCPECGEGTWVPLNDLRTLRWGPAAAATPQGGAFFDPVAQEGHIINTRTGEVRALHSVSHNDRFELYSTADGWVVADSETDQATVFAPDGRPLESFAISASAGTGDHKAALPIGGQTPTSAQLRDFLTTGEAPWAEGLLRARATTANDGATVCDTLSFTPTGSAHPTRETTASGVFFLQSANGQCGTSARNSAISEDHSVIHTWSHHGVDRDTLIDMHGVGLFHTSGTFTPVDATKGRYSKAVRVYDDLVLVIDYEGITALTPRGS